MKKTAYQTPTIMVMQINICDIICISSVGIGTSDANADNGTTDIEGSMLSRHSSIWDDDEDGF